MSRCLGLLAATLLATAALAAPAQARIGGFGGGFHGGMGGFHGAVGGFHGGGFRGGFVGRPGFGHPIARGAAWRGGWRGNGLGWGLGAAALGAAAVGAAYGGYYDGGYPYPYYGGCSCPY